MSVRKRILVTMAGAAIVLTALFFWGCGSLPDDAAAKVNGVIITRDDVAGRITFMRGLAPSGVPADPESEEYKDLQRNVTKQLVAEELERQAAEERGLSVSQEEIDEGLVDYVDDVYLGDFAKMEEQISQRGISVDDLRGDIERKLLHKKLLDSIRAEVSVSEDELLADYEANKDKYVYPEKRQIRQIVTNSQAEAEAAAARIAAGEEFSVVAGQVSVDGTTRDRGGLLGLVTKEALGGTGETAFSLEYGAVSQPFESGSKWYIVKVELIVPASNVMFEDVKEDLMVFKTNQKFAARFKEFSDNLWETSDIEYADDYALQEEGDTGTAPTDPATPVAPA